MNKKINFIDLFAGAGGLSEGFLDCGYTAIAHVEMNKDASDTLKTRACYYELNGMGKGNVYKNYISGKITRDELYSSVRSETLDKVINKVLSSETIDEVFNTIKVQMSKSQTEVVDLIIGGPPCQAYSLIGRAVKNDNMENDPRNFLYKLYGRFLDEFKPKVFIFENVPGLLSAKNGIYFENMKTYFASLGYDLDFQILNASDFQVLQNRRRVILIGWKKDLEFKYPVFEKKPSSFTVNELLSDLPNLVPGETKYNYKNHLTEYLRVTGIRKENDILIQHISRTHNRNDIDIYKYVIHQWNQNKKRVKYSELPKNLLTHSNREVFLDRYKVVASDLSASQTIMAHIAKDGHYFIHPDLEQARSISVREAARLQSFPDDFYFEGSRTAMFTQIGNAVPPLLSKEIAKSVRGILIGGEDGEQ